MTPCQLPGCAAPVVSFEDGWLSAEIDSPAWAPGVEDEPLPGGEADDLQRWLDLNA
jgi:hypothetical protein